MKLDQSIYDKAQQLSRKTTNTREVELLEQPAAPEDLSNLKSALLRKTFLSVGGARPSETELERLIGDNDLVDEFYLERALLVAQPVVRISIRTASGHERGCATGVMVSPRLLLTNEHVFRSAVEAETSIAEFNFRDDVAGQPMPSYRYRLRPDLFFFNDPDLDFALVSVEPNSLQTNVPLTRFGYNRLIPESGKARVGEALSIIQHPEGQRRQFAIRENRCTDDTDPNVLQYESDTAQGSSGAPVFNDSFQIAALHHLGKAKRDGVLFVLKDGRKVESLDGVDETLIEWVSNEGIRVSMICKTILANAREQNGHIAELRKAMEGGDVLSLAYEKANNGTSMGLSSEVLDRRSLSMPPTPSSGNTPSPITVRPDLNAVKQDHAFHIPIVLDLQVNLLGQSLPVFTGSQIVPNAGQQNDLELEVYKKPIIDTNYEGRPGFDQDFLGIKTPLPKITDKGIVAKMKNGKAEIPYEHFSVEMHKLRRLAIFTASNVDGRKASRQPEPGRDYSRKGLTGLNDNDREEWASDPRLDDAFQLPDKFFKNDRNAFDKGHIVRRDDVCWGIDYAQVQRSNGDTYHTTNCSPQRADFNQSTQNGLWGNLENFILKQAKAEKYNLFAGPVLADNDPVFTGVDNNGAVRVKIPRNFWKVVCAVKNGQLQVFGFMLEQKLAGVDLEIEFEVTPEWELHMRSLKEIEQQLGYLTFAKKLHDADQGK